MTTQLKRGRNLLRHGGKLEIGSFFCTSTVIWLEQLELQGGRCCSIALSTKKNFLVIDILLLIAYTNKPHLVVLTVSQPIKQVKLLTTQEPFICLSVHPPSTAVITHPEPFEMASVEVFICLIHAALFTL